MEEKGRLKLQKQEKEKIVRLFYANLLLWMQGFYTGLVR